jgi:hypothetical protein
MGHHTMESYRAYRSPDRSYTPGRSLVPYSSNQSRMGYRDSDVSRNYRGSTASTAYVPDAITPGQKICDSIDSRFDYFPEPGGGDDYPKAVQTFLDGTHCLMKVPEDLGPQLEIKKIEKITPTTNKTEWRNHFLSHDSVILSGKGARGAISILAFATTDSTLHQAYAMTMGTEYPFINWPGALAGLFNDIIPTARFTKRKWLAIVVGSRFADTKRPYLHTYFYTTDEKVRIQLAKIKKAFGEHLPMDVIIKDDCAPACESSEVSLAMSTAFEVFQKTLQVPSQVHGVAAFLPMLYDMLDHTSAPAQIDTLPLYYAETEPLCRTVCAITIDLIHVEHFFDRANDAARRIIYEYALVHFLCWLCDSTAAVLDRDAMAKFDVSLYVNDASQIRANSLSDRNPNINQAHVHVDHAAKYYLIGACHIVKVLKEMLEILLPKDHKEKSCLPGLYCAMEHFKSELDCVLSSINDIDTAATGAKLYCAMQDIRSKMMAVTNRLVEFFMLVQSTAAQMNLRAPLATECRCKMAMRVIPWYHHRSIYLEGTYRAVQILQSTCDPCTNRFTVPSPVMNVLRLRLLLLDALPAAFKNNEPDIDYMMKHITEHATEPSAIVAKQFIAAWQPLQIQERMAALGLLTHEMCQAETEISELLTWGIDHGLSSHMQKSTITRWITGVSKEFMTNLGKPSAVAINRVMEARKKRDAVLRDMLKDLLTHLRGAQNKTMNLLLELGISPLIDEILRSKSPEILQNLTAIKALKADGAKDMTCAASRAIRCGDIASQGLVNSLTNIADAYRSTVDAPLGRCSSLDMLLYQNTGMIDPQLNLYTVGHDDHLNYSYVRL